MSSYPKKSQVGLSERNPTKYWQIAIAQPNLRFTTNHRYQLGGEKVWFRCRLINSKLFPFFILNFEFKKGQVVRLSIPVANVGIKPESLCRNCQGFV
jgi:hypothetical protein